MPFNDDDLSWLNDDDSSESEESGGFDWDSGKQTSGDSGRTGLTGQLPWQQDTGQGGTPSQDRSGLTGNLDWQRSGDQGGAPSGDRSGLTGNLDWQNTEGGTPSQDRSGLTGNLDWQQITQKAGQDDDATWLGELAGLGEDDEPVEAEQASGEAIPDWLQDAQPASSYNDAPDFEALFNDEAPAAQAYGQPQQEDDAPDFDALFSDQAPAAQAAAEEDVPDWLRDNEPAQAYGQPQQDDDAPDFDALFSDAAPTSQDSEEEIPDWLRDNEPVQAYGQPQQDDAPNFDALFSDQAPAAQAAAEEEIPDWLRDNEPAQAYGQPQQDDAPNFDALFSGETSPVTANAASDQAEIPDWLQESEPAADFGALFDDQEEEFPLPQTGELVPRGEMQQETPQELPDDFLSSLGIDDEAPKAQSELNEDFLASLGFGDEDEPQQAVAQPTTEDDPFAEFNFEQETTASSAEQAPDWFAQEAAPAADDANWLDELGDPDALAAFQQQPSAAPQLEGADDDFLAELGAFEEETSPQPTSQQPQYEDLDSLLSSFGDSPLPQTGELSIMPTDVDIEALFADEAIKNAQAPASRPGDLAPDAPDWLSDLGASVSQVSASALVRQRKDRPLEDLDNRLQLLRERGMDLPTTAPAPPSAGLENVLAGVPETLAPAPMTPTSASHTSGGVTALTREQQERAKLLRALVGTVDDAQDVQRRAAIDSTYDSPNFDWMEDQAQQEAIAPVKPVASRRTRRRLSIPLERLLVTLLVLAGVIAPFMLDTARFGTLPPTAFPASSTAQAFFDRVNALTSRDLVLVAVEYNATAAGELDPMAQTVLYHALLRGARPVVVSRSPVSLLRAGNLLDAAGAAPGSYVLTRYLSADVIGLRALAETPFTLLSTDLNGLPTNLDVASLDDFALIIVFAERAEDLRAWAEQIAPLTNAPVIAGINYAAAPLSAPYQQAGSIEGVLVGAGDANTYADLLSVVTAGEALPTPRPATRTPRPEPTTAQPTSEPAAATSESAAPTAEAGVEGAPTDAGTPADSGTAAPEATPTREGSAVFATIRADGPVNIRSGPARTFQPVGTVDPGEQVSVIGTNEDNSWINIRTASGVEGWVADDFVEFAASPKIPATGKRHGEIRAGQDATDEPATPEPTAESTPEPTRTPRPTPSPEPTAEPTPEAATQTPIDARDTQWYASTLGLMVIVVVIAVGNLFNLIRGIATRRRN